MKDELRDDKIDGIAGKPVQFKDYHSNSPAPKSNSRIKSIYLIGNSIMMILLFFHLGIYLTNNKRINKEVEMSKLIKENEILKKKNIELENQLLNWRNNFSNSQKEILIELDRINTKIDNNVIIKDNVNKNGD